MTALMRRTQKYQVQCTQSRCNVEDISCLQCMCVRQLMDWETDNNRGNNFLGVVLVRGGGVGETNYCRGDIDSSKAAD